MKQHLPKFIILGFFCLFLALFLSRADAQVNNNDRTFTVIPPKVELSAKPGETIQDYIRLYNQSEEIATVSVKVSDFIIQNMSGRPELVDAEEAGEWALSQWITFSPQTLTIPPDQQGYVNFSVSVPANASPGGRYATIYFSEPGVLVSEDTITGVATEIRSLVLLRIEGPITEEALVRRFQAPRFSEYGPIEFTTEIANLGNYHIRPLGTIEVKNILGKTQATIELDDRNIFPKASYEYHNTWDSKWLFGRYKATFLATYGEQNLPLEATIFFWVWPWKITLVIIGVIVLIILIIFLIKYKKGRQELKPKEEEEESELGEENEEEEEE